jgi:hypothetical protein
MGQFGSSTCDFDVAETHDGKHRVIAIKPKDNHSLLNQGTLTFELNQGFELNDAETLAKMLKDWITQIHFEPID